MLRSIKAPILEFLLAVRALIFIGKKYVCPLCGWKLRTYTWGGISFRSRPLGYCPRCNSKARHRRLWLFLQEKTNLFRDHLALLQIQPNYCISRRLSSLPNLDYVAVADIYLRNISLKTDLAAIPIRSDEFDAILCNHILEHIPQDRRAMEELYRVLKPGGWAVISVPIRFDQETYEDAAITEPEARKRAFGEPEHVRIYGCDFEERLEKCGFRVQLNLGKDISHSIREKYGLRDDENLFYCEKPIA